MLIHHEGDLSQHSKDGKLWLLSKFGTGWETLQAGGDLLPDLVEFYTWLHTNLTYTLTKEEAETMSIGQIITLARDNLNKESGNMIWELYDRVMERYNNYVKLIKEKIGAGACAVHHHENVISTISEDTSLLHFLSGINCHKIIVPYIQ